MLIYYEISYLKFRCQDLPPMVRGRGANHETDFLIEGNNTQLGVWDKPHSGVCIKKIPGRSLPLFTPRSDVPVLISSRLL